MAAVDDQRATCHEAAGIADEEQRRATELFWLAQPLHHVRTLPERLQVRFVLEVLLDHGCVDVTGAE